MLASSLLRVRLGHSTQKLIQKNARQTIQTYLWKLGSKIPWRSCGDISFCPSTSSCLLQKLRSLGWTARDSANFRLEIRCGNRSSKQSFNIATSFARCDATKMIAATRCLEHKARSSAIVSGLPGSLSFGTLECATG